jgi:hypothetical protein
MISSQGFPSKEYTLTTLIPDLILGESTYCLQTEANLLGGNVAKGCTTSSIAPFRPNVRQHLKIGNRSVTQSGHKWGGGGGEWLSRNYLQCRILKRTLSQTRNSFRV